MSSIISSITTALTWLWSLFGDILDTITANSLLMYVVLVPIVIGVIMAVLRILRKFGVR